MIATGDLAMVVRTDHECGNQLLGKVFVVLAVIPHGPGIHCPKCGTRDMHIGSRAAQYTGTPGLTKGLVGWMPVSWLKKIDPPQERQDERHDEEITA